jgi:hypothetical protein
LTELKVKEGLAGPPRAPRSRTPLRLRDRQGWFGKSSLQSTIVLFCSIPALSTFSVPSAPTGLVERGWSSGSRGAGGGERIRPICPRDGGIQTTSEARRPNLTGEQSDRRSARTEHLHNGLYRASVSWAPGCQAYAKGPRTVAKACISALDGRRKERGNVRPD